MCCFDINKKQKKNMTEWALIIYCGLITFLTRFSMVALLKKEMFLTAF